ncbi:hypothetical protein CYMTET_54198 [Cymbomonas tetramitiformis]|uniref:Protein kinase domain-containing protein n=1 Tax=Cymbomonas tetramitiformis TaxID=36881 RepID=A0AAE0BH62_9CHLO|nr:hypothetical protein CYMTET_54198 [Cymbomonas tetramitiformis]
MRAMIAPFWWIVVVGITMLGWPFDGEPIINMASATTILQTTKYQECNANPDSCQSFFPGEVCGRECAQEPGKLVMTVSACSGTRVCAEAGSGVRCGTRACARRLSGGHGRAQGVVAGMRVWVGEAATDHPKADCENGTRVAVKVFLDAEDFHAERANCRRCKSPHVVKILDAHAPLVPKTNAAHCTSGAAALEQEEPGEALLRYGHLVMERGEHSLAEFLQRRPTLSAVRKLGIIHDVFVALRFLHDEMGMVHGDIKPANLVKFASDDVWKLVDFATASPVGEDAKMEYTLRYAAPEVVRAALGDSAGVALAAREPATDMWSAGVMMFELYTGRRLFGADTSDEQVVGQLIGGSAEDELVLKGLSSCEAGAARLIRDKLLIKDPCERWPAEKILSSSFFKRMEDTTRMVDSSRELGKDVRRLSVMVEETAHLAAVNVSEMQAGGLMVEVNLTETAPKRQSCILSEHERAGPVFNLVLQCQYHLDITIFREGGGKLLNPVKAILGAIFITTDGNPLPIGLLPAPLAPNTSSAELSRLPNSLVFVGAWAPSMCQSTLLVTKTKWPETRQVTLELQLELHDLPGRPVTIRHDLHFVVHKKDGAKLRALRAYQWAKQEYLNMTPETRAAIQGMVFAVQTGAGVLI